MKFSRPILFCLLVLGVLSLTTPFYAHALESADGIANNLDIADKNVQAGDLISLQGGKFRLTKGIADGTIYGIVTETPAILFESATQTSSAKPVVTTGTVYVRVSGKAGNISAGDFLTSSDTPGVAQKAVKTGYVIGNALDSYSPKKPGDIDTIRVNFHVFYYYSAAPAISKLFDIGKLTSEAAAQQPIQFFKYLIAAIILIIAIVLAVFSFGRMANTGLQALGRNPLASRMIQLGLFFNVLISIAIILAGFALAYLVIRL